MERGTICAGQDEESDMESDNRLITMPYRPILLLMLALGALSLVGAGTAMPPQQPAAAVPAA